MCMCALFSLEFESEEDEEEVREEEQARQEEQVEEEKKEDELEEEKEQLSVEGESKVSIWTRRLWRVADIGTECWT